jgi:tellurite methyltransferase
LYRNKRGQATVARQNRQTINRISFDWHVSQTRLDGELLQEMDIREKWNDRYRAASDEPRAARVLSENLHLLPAAGRALDLACGRGGNALLLAAQGLEVEAWDIADVAVAALQAEAARRRLPVRARVRDVEARPPGPESFDVIVVSYFLDRDLIPALVQALRPGGLVFYQTFTRQRVSNRGPQQAQYRLDEQELLRLFAGLQVLFYREEGRVGDLQQGIRDEAMFIGRQTDSVDEQAGGG